MSRRSQAAKQCDVVAHLCRALIDVHEDRARILRTDSPAADGLVEITGDRTAYLMEMLGDVLSGMDAVDPKEDGWTDSIYAEAHQMWPQRSN